MALSEQEQRLLDEMERGFYKSEADVVGGGSGQAPQLNYRALATGLLIAVVGLGLLVAAVAFAFIWLGVIAFLVMTVGVTRAFVSEGSTGERPSAGSGAQRGGGSGSSGTKAKRGGSFTERFEQRWEDRMNRDS